MLKYKIINKDGSFYIEVPYANNNIISEFITVRKFQNPYWVTTDEAAVQALEAEILRANDIAEHIDVKYLSTLTNGLFICHNATRTTKNRKEYEEKQQQLRNRLDQLAQAGYVSEYLESVNHASYNRPDRDKFEPLSPFEIARTFNRQ